MSPLLGLALIALLIAVLAWIRSARAWRAIEHEQTIQAAQLEIIDDQLRNIRRDIHAMRRPFIGDFNAAERARYWK